ncbi:MAG TPA: rRNA maturation RNase YbeY [Dehalococcoidia bacterium]|jgi:probable rRNA maturation factor|nr:rRNA maturation RNase YbeY [Dehalococcoidia bacterium]
MARRVLITLLPGTRGRITAPELRRIARRVLDAENVAPHVEVEIVLAGEESSRELNRLYRGRDEPADVLSFASHEGEAFLDAPDAAPSIGEIVICVPLVERQLEASPQSGEANRTVSGEIAHLLTHGLLHVLGYDHELGEAESLAMKRREDDLLTDLGYAGAYAHGH